MEPYQQRVVDEKTALDEKIEKLESFIETKVFYNLVGDEKYMLTRQLDIMKVYSEILEDRISAFSV